MNWKTLLLAAIAAAFIGGCMPKDTDANAPVDVDQSQINATPSDNMGNQPGGGLPMPGNKSSGGGGGATAPATTGG